MRQNLKELIIQDLLQILYSTKSSSVKMSKDFPITFTSQEVSDRLAAYKVSIRRELRALRQMKLINYKIKDRLGGIYILLPRKGRYTYKNLESLLYQALENVKHRERPSNSQAVRKMLNDIRR